MAAALPHVDLFLAGNNLGSLEQLAASMERGFERAERGGAMNEVSTRSSSGERGATGSRWRRWWARGARRRGRPGRRWRSTSTAQIAGAVSGGCVEGAVATAAYDVLETGVPRLLSFGIADEEAFEVGLPCGGEIDVFVEELVD